MGNFDFEWFKSGLGDRKVLQCPRCGPEHHAMTHLTDVFVLGRVQEDGDLVPVHVKTNGELGSGPYPVSERGLGRRDEVTLAFYCEEGHQFRVTFQQHKGETYVEAAAQWTSPTGINFWSTIPPQTA